MPLVAAAERLKLAHALHGGGSDASALQGTIVKSRESKHIHISSFFKCLDEPVAMNEVAAVDAPQTRVSEISQHQARTPGRRVRWLESTDLDRKSGEKVNLPTSG